jgi:F-type H+-transporting ATPase subunit a
LAPRWSWPNSGQKYAKIACEKFHDAATSRPLPARKAGFHELPRFETAIFTRVKHLLRAVLVTALLVSMPAICGAAEHADAAVQVVSGATEHGGATAEKHELPLYPVEIGKIGNFPITNSMLVTWIVALALIIFAQIATRNIQAVPSGAQNFWEWLVESLYNFLENIIGRDLVKKTFWFFATIFIFILFCNWFGLIPGVGTIGWGHKVGGHFHLDQPWLRGANADLNMTFAMAIIFFLCWIVWALQSNGIGGFLAHIFAPKGQTTGALKVMMIVVFFLVGVLEVVSILFRPVSLSFRLFGNVYAGESMLEAMAALVPKLAWLIPIPFYFLEILVGLVQALVFMLLTAVFTLLICQHDENHAKAHHH